MRSREVPALGKGYKERGEAAFDGAEPSGAVALEQLCSQFALENSHPDRGVPYAIAAYVGRLLAAGTRISMSAKRNPDDNAEV